MYDSNDFSFTSPQKEYLDNRVSDEHFYGLNSANQVPQYTSEWNSQFNSGINNDISTNKTNEMKRGRFSIGNLKNQDTPFTGFCKALSPISSKKRNSPILHGMDGLSIQNKYII